MYILKYYNVIQGRLKMKEEMMCVRVEPELKRDIELVSKVLHVSSSEWIRNRIAYAVKELILDMKNQIVLEYLRGNLTKKELKQLFGKKLADNIDFVIEKVKKDLLKAKEVAKALDK
jgi:hypothetical protein